MSRDYITDPYPRGYENPVNLRASAALEAVGAWDAAPVESPSTNAKHLMLTFTYTRGAAGGAFDWQLWTSPYSVVALVPAAGQEWTAPAIYGSGGVAAGVDTQSRTQREYETYQATGAAVESFTYGPIPLEGVIERIRVRARESGIVVTPGALQITGELI